HLVPAGQPPARRSCQRVHSTIRKESRGRPIPSAASNHSSWGRRNLSCPNRFDSAKRYLPSRQQKTVPRSCASAVSRLTDFIEQSLRVGFRQFPKPFGVPIVLAEAVSVRVNPNTPPTLLFQGPQDNKLGKTHAAVKIEHSLVAVAIRWQFASPGGEGWRGLLNGDCFAGRYQ